MGWITGGLGRLSACVALMLLAACDDFPFGSVQTSAPARPATIDSIRDPAAQASSAELRRYYRQVLMDGQTRGLLRTDGGGPDTPYSADVLARNFEEIAFFNEYQAGEQPLRRWVGPVRVQARFGASVDPAAKTRDQNALAGYVSRLAQITGHPITTSARSANFVVFFANEPDRAQTLTEIRRLLPGVDGFTLNSIRDIPRSTYCLVVAVTDPGNPSVYTRAVALIRAEQPDLMRLSCIHEELAQGLGLANDSPYARPSIFNDDDEFALLTSHDEKLLAMLYDERLKPGMRLEQARGVIRILAREITGAEL